MNKPKFILPTDFAKKVSGSRKSQIHYISSYFSKSLFYHPKDTKLVFGLPHPYVVPDHKHFKEFFYWDSFFIFLGLLVYKDTQELCKGIIQNFAYELKRFGRIPNSNTYTSLSRSQSPYFALVLWEYIKKYPNDAAKQWIVSAVKLCIQEYEDYWLATDKRYADHKTTTGLSRYWDLNCDFDGLTIYESGWDTSSRFNEGCMTLNPIDLNSQLYVYEKFFHWYDVTYDKGKHASHWGNRMKERAQKINEFCWDEKQRMYCDFHFVKNERRNFVSAASFFPFFAGFPEKEKAQQTFPNLLKILEYEGGISSSQKAPLKASQTNQWDHPHGWAPLHYIAYNALRNYGFNAEAKRIKDKWLKVCDYWFQKDHCFYEKYNVVKIGKPIACTTPARPGFGWTNAIYLKFLFEE